LFGHFSAGKNRLYVVLDMFATGLMATPVFGTINVGLLFRLAQFLSTFAITGLYVRSNRTLGGLVGRIGEPGINIAIFAAFVVITLAIAALFVSTGRSFDYAAKGYAAPIRRPRPLSAHFRYRPGPSSYSANVAGSR
jgi:hypothetical protein